jgi:hypothetical protein
MTKSEFLALVYQGWFKLDLAYHREDFFGDDFNSLDPTALPTCACAMGAAAYADGGFRNMREWLLKHNLIEPDTTYGEIAHQVYLISDLAGSKEKAFLELDRHLPTHLFEPETNSNALPSDPYS